ncbi:MAG: chitobiase/beta-hexosaminidase C-terminal domain-containing protein, partial [Verrucomicrobiales bacterium]|nr:chitobiase/beta-hexosaminidase C-terminal domain-containing protein [Verrucomicrobiales bacterium]
MRDCVVGENVAQGDSAGGGGVVFRKSIGSVVASTVVSNRVRAGTFGANKDWTRQGTGGAIGQWEGEVALTNCTVVANIARGGDGIPGIAGGPGWGGGIYGLGGACRIVHCTFTLNRAEGGSAGVAEPWVGAPPAIPGDAGGGGLYLGEGATCTLANSLFFGNSLERAESASEGFGTVVSVGRNLVGTATNLLGLTSLDLVGADPRLGALRDRGGPTPTLSLGGGSAAFDAAAPEWAPGVDQRGTARPLGAGPDIGAIEEFEEPSLAVSLVVDEAAVEGEAVTNLGPARVAFASNRPAAAILYTLDGSIPDHGSAQYTGPMTLARDTRIRFFAYEPDFAARTDVTSVDLVVVPDSRAPLNARVVGGGRVRMEPGPGPYPRGTVVRLVAVPEDGWRFGGWSGDASGAAEAIDLRMDGERTVTAEFVPVATFSLSVGTRVRGFPPYANYPRGIVELDPPGGVYVSNTLVTARAKVLRIPLVTGSFGFGRWVEGATGSDSTIVLRMDRPRSLMAEFDYVRWSGLLGCWLRLEAIGGGDAVETSPGTGGSFYFGGSWAGLLARPARGWTLLQWTGDVVGDAVTNGLWMERDAHVIAVFGTSLRRVSSGSGTIEVTP